MEAVLPPNEEARLRALHQYDVLDTPTESDFDDIVELAATICGTPISLVSLVDRDRQWFKGHYGLDISETPRKLSFCAHTILEPSKTLEVEDATRDERFADNELVSGPRNFRFYAGAPLVTPEGQAIGTLCVIDTKAKTLTPPQKRALEILSRQVVTQLELRRKVWELEVFSFSLSHDLRAPLRTIRGFTELVMEDCQGQSNKETADYLQKVITATERLDALITDVLAFAKLSGGNSAAERVDVEQLVRQLAEDRPDLQEPNATLKIESPLGAVIGNKTALAQCFANLLSNAVKYVAPGVKPHLRVFSTTAEGAGRSRRRVVVEDNGIGVPSHERNRIFGVFQRLHSSATYEGTGVGLAIVKRAVERMGGAVGVDSNPKGGSQFWIELNAAVP